MSERTLVLIKPDGVERRPGRRGHRPDRAQGPVAGGAGAARGRAGRRRGALRRARGQGLLREPARVHHRRTAGRHRSSRVRGRSPRSGSWPAAPTRWRRPPPAASAATSAWRPSTTWCTVRIRRSPPPGRSRSGSRTCDRVPPVPARGVRREPIIRRIGPGVGPGADAASAPMAADSTFGVALVTLWHEVARAGGGVGFADPVERADVAPERPCRSSRTCARAGRWGWRPITPAGWSEPPCSTRAREPARTPARSTCCWSNPS